MPDSTDPTSIARRDIAERLGRLYRHGRLLRRLLRLLDDADRIGLPLTTADNLANSPQKKTKGADRD